MSSAENDVSVTMHSIHNNAVMNTISAKTSVQIRNMGDSELFCHVLSTEGMRFGLHNNASH